MSTPTVHPTADPDPEDSDPRRLASTVGASGVIPCFGPTGRCVHPEGLGHGGDHVPPQSVSDSLADIKTVLLFAAGRLHDGSQFDEDMEGLLLDARLQLAQMGTR